MSHTKTPLDQLSVEFGERPHMPTLPDAGPEHRRAGKHLAAIHRYHLSEMHRVGRILDHIAAGLAPAQELGAALNTLDLMDNMRAFGTLCGQECRVLTFHHDAEEQRIFPELEAAQNAELSAVVARLRAEHEIVHELLERLSSAAKNLSTMPSPGQFAETKAIFARLLSVVKSHFGYEETELEEALGLFASPF